MAQQESVLQVTNLDKKYGEQRAVKNLNLTIHIGEIYGFLGRNGAGETTTIHMTMNLIKPMNGEIRLFGNYYLSNTHGI